MIGFITEILKNFKKVKILTDSWNF